MAAEELLRTLTDLGLEQYLPNCLQAGFHNFQSLSSITEAELNTLGVRLGHRRKLLRKIARDHQWPDNRPLPTSYSELQQHRNSIRRLHSANRDPELVEENYYSLTSDPQSQSQSPSPSSRSRETPSPSNSSVSSRENLDGTSKQLADVLRMSSRRFPFNIHEEDVKNQEREKVFRALRGLDNIGISIPAADADPFPKRTPESEKSLHDVMPHGLESGLSSEAGAGRGTKPLETFFEAFIQSFNHFLFLFSEYELRRSFDPHECTSDADLPADIYLVLALGAKASVFPVEDLQNEWYRRARLRLLSEDCRGSLWMMRVLTLICIFEIDDDIDVSYHFLAAATSIGLDNGLDAPNLIQKAIKDPELSQWLRVWDTIRFLNLWFLLQPQAMGIQLSETAHFMNIEQPPLWSEYCRNGRLVQMSIASLSNHLREILHDRRDWANRPSSLLYKAHLQALDSWHAGSPSYASLLTPSLEDSRMVNTEASFRQKTAILNVQSLFLGIVCVLLQPALMTVIQDNPSSGADEFIGYARRCVVSATILIRLCNEIAESGYPLSASWISQHFLFNATLVLIADMNRSNSALEEFTSPREHLECIQIAQKLLDQASSTTSPRATIVRLFRRASGLADIRYEF